MQGAAPTPRSPAGLGAAGGGWPSSSEACAESSSQPAGLMVTVTVTGVSAAERAPRALTGTVLLSLPLSRGSARAAPPPCRGETCGPRGGTTCPKPPGRYGQAHRGPGADGRRFPLSHSRRHQRLNTADRDCRGDAGREAGPSLMPKTLQSLTGSSSTGLGGTPLCRSACVQASKPHGGVGTERDDM